MAVAHGSTDRNASARRGVNGLYSHDTGGTFISDFAFRLDRHKLAASPPTIDVCNTSTFLCRRDDFLAAGGFPRFETPTGEEIRGREDAAFAYALTKGGRGILMAREIGVGHHFRADWIGFLRQQAMFASRLGITAWRTRDGSRIRRRSTGAGRRCNCSRSGRRAPRCWGRFGNRGSADRSPFFFSARFCGRNGR
ncbi:MAG: hypothetical protein M5R36_18625 [Deltaproteobacteria bacterium]|nr:hypothetical protein [Deltaproteobacteria bacterium]